MSSGNDFLTVSEVERVEADPVLTVDDVVAYRRDRADG